MLTFTSRGFMDLATAASRERTSAQHSASGSNSSTAQLQSTFATSCPFPSLRANLSRE